MRISDWSSDVCSSDLQNDIGKAVVDLQEIHVLALDARHVESARGSIAEANLEGIGPRGDVVGGIGVAFRGTGDADGHMRHIPGPTHSRYYNRAGPIGLKPAIVKQDGPGYPASRMKGFRVGSAPIGKDQRIKLRV